MDFIYYNYSALIKGEYFFGGGFGMYVWGLRLGYVVCMGLFVDVMRYEVWRMCMYGYL